MTPDRAAVLETLADLVPVPAGEHAVRVGVDGVDGAGKTTVADELAAVLRSRGRQVVRVRLDDFHHPRDVRYRRGRDSPEGFFHDSYDLVAVRQEVLDPLGPDGDRWYRPAVHDVATDVRLDPPPRQAPSGAVLVLDGLFLHRGELADAWDLSVLVTAPFEATYARMAVRDGSPADPHHPANRRYLVGQQLYFAAVDPERRADVVLDNADVDHPRLVRRPT